MTTEEIKKRIEILEFRLKIALEYGCTTKATALRTEIGKLESKLGEE